jgi:prevent-host-death family protein
VKQTSLAQAKAHLSKLVDDAEHHGVRTLIHRHGKPSAVIVPVAVGAPKKAKPRMTREQFEALLAEGAKYDDPNYSAVQDLIASRR